MQAAALSFPTEPAKLVPASCAPSGSRHSFLCLLQTAGSLHPPPQHSHHTLPASCAGAVRCMCGAAPARSPLGGWAPSWIWANQKLRRQHKPLTTDVSGAGTNDVRRMCSSERQPVRFFASLNKQETTTTHQQRAKRLRLEFLFCLFFAGPVSGSLSIFSFYFLLAVPMTAG